MGRQEGKELDALMQYSVSSVKGGSGEEGRMGGGGEGSGGGWGGGTLTLSASSTHCSNLSSSSSPRPITVRLWCLKQRQSTASLTQDNHYNKAQQTAKPKVTF